VGLHALDKRRPNLLGLRGVEHVQIRAECGVEGVLPVSVKVDVVERVCVCHHTNVLDVSELQQLRESFGIGDPARLAQSAQTKLFQNDVEVLCLRNLPGGNANWTARLKAAPECAERPVEVGEEHDS
jgi:hypothetical protein